MTLQIKIFLIGLGIMSAIFSVIIGLAYLSLKLPYLPIIIGFLVCSYIIGNGIHGQIVLYKQRKHTYKHRW